jgi:hypothetical protein
MAATRATLPYLSNLDLEALKALIVAQHDELLSLWLRLTLAGYMYASLSAAITAEGSCIRGGTIPLGQIRECEHRDLADIVAGRNG